MASKTWATKVRASAERWKPVPQYPLSELMSKACAGPRKRAVKFPQLANDELGDHMLQRISPFLRRNAPLDILDLWPGNGLWSSKINEALRPRRHVLLEPELQLWGKFLEPLAKNNECYKIDSTNPRLIEDWKSILTQYFPEQGPENSDNSGALPCNHTLLVLANLSMPNSNRDHMTATRWMSMFLDSCLRQTGLHSYGAVRILATMPQEDAQAILPRQVNDRKRLALIAENVALHNFEVAAHQEDYYWANTRGFERTKADRERLNERATANGFPPIPGREPAPFVAVPDLSLLDQPVARSSIYTLRILTEAHANLLKTIEELGNTPPTSPDYAKARAARGRLITRVRQEHQIMSITQALSRKLARLDELSRNIARVAARPTTTLADLEPLLSETAAVKQEIADTKIVNQKKSWSQMQFMWDDTRRQASDELTPTTLLAWDRRPFEALLINDEELYPRGDKRSMIYFEPNPDSPVASKFSPLDAAARADAHGLFEVLSLSLWRGREIITLHEILPLVFPGRSINDCVRAIPSLAQHAIRTPKPDFDSLPKTLVSDANSTNPDNNNNNNAELDPALCFQENLNYDFKDVRLHIIGCPVIWDICIEYSRYESRQSLTQLARSLGATMTGYRAGAHILRGKKIH
ncbi:uncharacterized protein BO97DRAFT_63261 [Aspergillus homomorphus CBS 101889]|uniref:rRNA adenine N(6)-methyltransferase n=1 Tax=Aspergillus homomorphus (strain CBS 101889) TaxID=1450537 RepID=A0A395HWS9_ASPHC|nr:hypothetical protein BO97DRAFT_63261 [Aspergillus homomorphus CBS 101889]RAL12250.1 hypothetical protein BO97DRAFT_63261 [Aspergillus homomorphus CBS 101889]